MKMMSYELIGGALQLLLWLSLSNGKAIVEPTKMEMYDKEYHDTYLELNIGKDYFEGDILLTQAQSDVITKIQRKKTLQARALVKDMRKLWPNKIIPYVFAEGLRPETLDNIKSAHAEWEEKTCLKFKEREGEEDYIKYLYDGGCSSFVGRIGGPQNVSVGSSEDTCQHGNIVHVTAHALGFFHEHTRPDRDDFVEVKWDNIIPGDEKHFHKETLETVDSRDVRYDYGSVMHFGRFFYSVNAGEETLHPKEDGANIGQRMGLSELDTEQALRLYDCDSGTDGSN